MKIEGPGKTTDKTVSRTKKKSGAGGVDFDSLLSGAAENAQTSAAAEVSSVSRLDALLGLQEGDDFTDSKNANEQAQLRAEILLDQLDRMRVGMLNGAVSRSNLQALGRMIASHRSRISDPQLAAILDEIDLRAQVELAKYTSAD